MGGFFLSGFSFTDTDNSQDNRGREGTIFYSTLQRSGIYLRLCTRDDYHIYLRFHIFKLQRFYLPDCYSMRLSTLSNYYLIDWSCDVGFRLFACWLALMFCYSYMTWETGGLELASAIILVLQANRLTKCATVIPMND